jgi:hypothetical protein
MKYLKLFESFSDYIDITVSEANKIKSLPGFEFLRRYSDIYGYYLDGRRVKNSMESIYITKIKKKDSLAPKIIFELSIRRMPGYFHDLRKSFWSDENIKSLEWNHSSSFDNIEELNNFLLRYKWYDIEQYKMPYKSDTTKED